MGRDVLRSSVWLVLLIACAGRSPAHLPPMTLPEDEGPLTDGAEQAPVPETEAKAAAEARKAAERAGGVHTGLPAAPKAWDDAPDLLEGLGSLEMPISTRSRQAQAWFDQGLRLAYAFNHDESIRSFRTARKIDPTCAMCAWGAAYQLGPNVNVPALPDRIAEARAEIAEAQRLGFDASDKERALIDALAKRYAEDGVEPEARRRQDEAYADAMGEVASRFPEDPDVATLRAEALMLLRPWDYWTSSGAPQPGVAEARAVLERAIAEHTGHPGLDHFYIHLMEASPTPEVAEAAADRLARQMPGAGHLVHMPTHIYIHVGRWRDAAAANRAAVAADRAYLREVGEAPGVYGMYVAHNHMFLSSVAGWLGRAGESVAQAREAAETFPRAMIDMPMGMDGVLSQPVLALARFGRWEEVLAEPAPEARYPVALAWWHYARGLAQAALGRTVEADTERASLARLREELPEGAAIFLNDARTVLDEAELALAGRIAAADGKTEEAIRSLSQAIQIEDGLRYDEPEDFPWPARHLLGDVLLDAGRAKEAEAVWLADLEDHPENGWALNGLAAALRAQGRTKEAVAVERRLAAAWADADVPRPGS